MTHKTKSVLLRFGRVVLAAGAAALLTAAISNVPMLELEPTVQTLVLAILTGILAAVDKYLRFQSED